MNFLNNLNKFFMHNNNNQAPQNNNNQTHQTPPPTPQTVHAGDAPPRVRRETQYKTPVNVPIAPATAPATNGAQPAQNNHNHNQGPTQ